MSDAPVDAPVIVGLGGNTGDVPARLRWAAAELGHLPGVTSLRLSSLWRSAPVGPEPEQPWFVNAAVELAGAPPPPAELLTAMLGIEARAGRDRAHELAMGPRPLDLDLLLYGAQVVHGPGLIVPHPRLRERAFALAPLCELVGPDLIIPGAGRAGDLLERALAAGQRVKWIG